MIELTKEEVIHLLQAFSRIDGFLMSVRDSHDILEMLDNHIEMLINKLKDDK